MASQTAIYSEKRSLESYFKTVERLPGRHEYRDGAIQELESADANHSKINTDTSIYLHSLVRDKHYQAHGNDMLIVIPGHNSYVFADFIIVDGEQKYADKERRLLTNPSLIVEVLSEKSAGYDRGERFEKYRSLSSFREYLMIDSRRFAVESWHREDDDTWRLSESFARDGKVYLHSLKAELPLEEIYRRVHFDD